MERFTKDTVEVLDYRWSFADQMTADGDTIAGTPVITAPSPLVLTSQSNTTTTVTGWLSGGVDNAKYVVPCVMTTAGNRTYRRSIIIDIQPK